jgi:hypothetical protein
MVTNPEGSDWLHHACLMLRITWHSGNFSMHGGEPNPSPPFSSPLGAPKPRTHLHHPRLQSAFPHFLSQSFCATKHFLAQEPSPSARWRPFSPAPRCSASRREQVTNPLRHPPVQSRGTGPGPQSPLGCPDEKDPDKSVGSPCERKTQKPNQTKRFSEQVHSRSTGGLSLASRGLF